MLTLLGCQGANDAEIKRDSTVVAQKTLAIMPDDFVEEFNAGVPVVVESILGNATPVQSLSKLYTIYAHQVAQGKNQGVFTAEIGPRRTTIFGRTHLNGELNSVGVTLVDKTEASQQEFLIAVATAGYVLTGEDPQRLRKMIMRLIKTVLENPEEAVSVGAGPVLFTASLSKTGIVIQVEQRQ